MDFRKVTLLNIDSFSITPHPNQGQPSNQIYHVRSLALLNQSVPHQFRGPLLEYGEGEVVEEHVLWQCDALKPVDVRAVARLLDLVRGHYGAAPPDEASVADHGAPGCNVD